MCDCDNGYICLDCCYDNGKDDGLAGELMQNEYKNFGQCNSYLDGYLAGLHEMGRTTLKDIPFDTIKVGTRVKTLYLGNIGYVSRTLTVDGRKTVEITWLAGRRQANTSDIDYIDDSMCVEVI